MACVNIRYFLQVTEIYYCRIRDIGGMEGWKLRVDDLKLTIIGWFRSPKIWVGNCWTEMKEPSFIFWTLWFGELEVQKYMNKKYYIIVKPYLFAHSNSISVIISWNISWQLIPYKKKDDHNSPTNNPTNNRTN